MDCSKGAVTHGNNISKLDFFSSPIIASLGSNAFKDSLSLLLSPLLRTQNLWDSEFRMLLVFG